MGKLAEYLKSEAESLRAEKNRRHNVMKEWLELLDKLFHQVDEWLTACDPEGLLDRLEETVKLNDPALGEYSAPSRQITLGDKTAQLVPKARYISRTLIRPPGTEKAFYAHGVVELRDFGGPRFYLFQAPNGNWYIQTEPRPLRAFTENAVLLLDAESFESALMSLVR